MRSRLLGVVAAAAIASFGCQGEAATSPGPPTAFGASQAASPSPGTSATPVDYQSLLFDYHYDPTSGRTGGKVIVSDWTPPDQLDPAYAYSASAWQVFAATMRTLFTITSDGRWKPDLAAKMPTFSNGTIRTDATGGGFSVDVELRTNLKWSDGRPTTMNDLRYTWQFLTDPKNVGVTAAGYDEIDKITVVDDQHATVHFREAYAGFYGVLGGLFLPEHYFATVDVADASKKLYPLSPDIKNAVTIGPFKYANASTNTIELVRDDGWAGPADACAPRACLDAVTFSYYPGNKQGMIAAFLGGEIDVIGHLAESDYQVMRAVDPAVGKALISPAWLYELLAMNEAGLGQGHPALKDIVVRKAIAQAIDKSSLYRTVFPGARVPETDACVNATPTNYWQLPDATCPTFDVTAANAALDAAGYRKGSDGIRTMPNDPGTKLAFELCTTPETFRETGGQFIAKSLQAVGMQAAVIAVDPNTVLFAGWPDVAADAQCNLAHGNYDLAEYANGLSFDLFSNYYYTYHSEQIPTAANEGNGYNWLRFSDPEMDATLDTLKTALRPDEQVQAAYAEQRIYVDRVAEVPLYYRSDVNGVSARLNDFFPNPAVASNTWNIQDWWLSP